MTQTMTAVRMYAPGDIRMEQVAVPEPGAGEVLMRVAACGVCGSDLDRMYVKGAHNMPLTCGHEFSAYIEALGPGVSQVAVGDLVTVPPMLPCGKCAPCTQGHYSLCLDYDYYGSRRDGAYAEYVAGPAAPLVPVPEGLDPRAAAMVDPSAIALHGLWRSRLTVGDRVAVLGGGGPIGLFAVQWARIMGASQIVAVDTSEEKAELARQAGATTALADPGQLAEVTGAGFDVVVETSGVAPVADQAVGAAGRHADVVLIGIPNSAVQISDVNWARLMRLEISIRGSWNSFSAPFPGAEWTTTLAKMASGDLAWEFMITHELGLDKVDETISAMADRSVHSVKVLFRPELTSR